MFIRIHQSNATLAPLRLKSPAMQLIVEQLVKANVKEEMKNPH